MAILNKDKGLKLRIIYTTDYYFQTDYTHRFIVEYHKEITEKLTNKNDSLTEYLFVPMVCFFDDE